MHDCARRIGQADEGCSCSATATQDLFSVSAVFFFWFPMAWLLFFKCASCFSCKANKLDRI